MPINLSATIIANEDVAFREIEQEGVLLNLETGTYFGLNDVGTRAWALLAEGRPIADVLTRLEQEYTVTREALERDVLGWIDTLLAKGLVRQK